MDLDLSLTCCKALVERMRCQLSKFHLNADAKLDTASKIKLILGGKFMDDIQKMVERQTALNLLLTACGWHFPRSSIVDMVLNTRC